MVLLCALAEGTQLEGNRSSLRLTEMVGAVAITALTMTDMDTMIGLGRETVGRMNVFSGVMLPVVAVLTAATGGVSSAALHRGAVMLFSKLLLTVLDRLLIPLI